MTDPFIAQKVPSRVKAGEGKNYFRCSCGKSANQPFWDIGYKDLKTSVNFTAPASKSVFLRRKSRQNAAAQHPLQAAVGLSPQRGQNNKGAAIHRPAAMISHIYFLREVASKQLQWQTVMITNSTNIEVDRRRLFCMARACQPVDTSFVVQTFALHF